MSENIVLTKPEAASSSQTRTEERIALHRRMAESYYKAYLRQGVQEGEKYEAWKFAEDADGWYPYFTGQQTINILKTGMDPFKAAAMEAITYSAKFPDWKPTDFKCWPSENGFAMRTKWEGTTRDGKRMSFWSVGLVETNDRGEVTHWETLIDGEEFGPFLEVALGVRGPFKGETAGYMAAVGRALQAAGVKMGA